MKISEKRVTTKSKSDEQKDRIVIVPDVHGRTFWREVLEKNTEDCIVFLGDYSDPYPNEEFTHEDALRELSDIIEFKKAHPERIILLLGNHDDHYIHPNHACWRFSRTFFDAYNKVYTENMKLFQIAYQWNEYLFTHAGLTSGWWDKHKAQFDSTVSFADSLNKAYKENPEIFYEVSEWRGGRDTHSSPIWADIEEHDLKGIESVIQLFGHSQLKDKPLLSQRINCLDCRRVFVLEDGEIKTYGSKPQ